MARVEADWIILLSFSALVGVITYYQPDGQTILRLSLKSLMAFGLVAFVIQLLGPVINRASKKIKSGRDTVKKYKSLSSEEIKRRQEKARDTVQATYLEKSVEYDEKVLKPREEAKKAQKEKEFYRFQGPAWKGHGEKLGSSEENGEVKKFMKDGSSRDAAEARKSQDVATSPDDDVTEKPVKQKKVIVLPEEPPEGATDCVIVALRTPLGKTYKRRFLCSAKIQVILDYMSTVGYSQTLYDVAMSYPRLCLSTQTQNSLADLGMDRAVLLNVEEKDWDQLADDG